MSSRPTLTSHITTIQKCALLAVLLMLGLWLFRYEPMPRVESDAQGPVLLDRWTGNLLVTSREGATWIDIQSLETRSKE